MADLPQNWNKSEKSLRAVQLVFEFSKTVADAIRFQATTQGISTSDQIRLIIGLPTKKPQRPRLSVSLSEEDYLLLGARYGLPPEDKAAIRQAIANELLEFSATAQAPETQDGAS